LETGELQLRLAKGDIIHFINEIINAFREYAIDRRIRFQFTSEQDYALEWFDPDKLDKILYNLLSNAFKFTPHEGEITVYASIITPEQVAEHESISENPGRMIKIAVQDSGIGIPEDKTEHIFKRFYHIENDKLKNYEGSGIGLTFVYELVQLYQGDISINSVEGHGTKFTLLLPLDENYLEDKQIVSEFNYAADLISHDENMISEKSGDLKEESLDEPEEMKKNVPLLLIVEDDKEIRDYIKKSLAQKYRIFCAENGKAGIKQAYKIIPDLIISDIKMPEITGIQLCNDLKVDDKTSHVPIILLTGYSSHELKMEGLRTGADAYLAKPFNIDELDAQIANLLESRRKLREKYSRVLYLEDKKILFVDIDEKFLNRVVETVESNISDASFNAEALSKLVGMSRMQLYRKLRGLTDQTVHEFIRSIRLRRAVHLLKESRKTITEVAFDVGFNDLTYFARCFRKQYNKSPSEFISERN
jgi:DNA-binding response OmpR family regulator